MELTPLTLGAVRTLARDSEVDAERLHEVSGGNPFFVTEVVAGGLDSATVRDAVLARVAQLTAPSVDVLAAVSVAPRSLAVEHVAALTGHGPEAVDAAVRAGLLVEADRSLGFRHELARTAVEDDLGPARRRALHDGCSGAARGGRRGSGAGWRPRRSARAIAPGSRARAAGGRRPGCAARSRDVNACSTAC